MKNKTIEDLFKENEHKLAEQPSAATWSRIEQRLQTEQGAAPVRPSAHRLHVRYVGRVVAFAAAIALVLGLAISFLWVTDTAEDDTVNALQGNTVPLEELPLLPAPQVAAHRAIPLTPITRQRPVRPIREGVAGQRLIVKTDATPPAALPQPAEDTAQQERPQRVGR